MLRYLATIIFLVPVLFLVSCSTPPPPVTTQIMLPTSVAGTTIPENEIDSVRFGENVKAYTIGRYIDPNNTDVMYEKNIVYRIEESNTWNLQPNEPFSIPFRKYEENRQKLINIQRPLTAELEAEVGNQQELRKKLKENNENFGQIFGIVQNTAKNTDTIVNSQTVIAKKIQLIESQMVPIRKQIDELKNEAGNNAERLQRIEQISEEHDKLILKLAEMKKLSVEVKEVKVPENTEESVPIPNINAPPVPVNPVDVIQDGNGFSPRK